MEAGRLNQRVEIHKPVGNASGLGHGGTKPTWQLVATRWAEVIPVRAAEMIRAGQPGMETTYTVRMRFTDLVTPESKLIWNGQELEISSVINVNGRSVDLEIMAHEREPTNAA